MRKSHDSTDAHTRLLVRAQEGSPEAFRDLYTALRPMVRDFIASLGDTSCRREREDLVQEVFVRVWERRIAFRREASAKTFTLSIARNIALKHMSTWARLPMICQDDWTDAPGPPQPDACEQEEVIGIVRQAMAKLTAVQREAIELAVFHGLPRPEALRLAKCSANQFANRLRRGKVQLRRQLSSLR